jgi:hypothetical protein
MFLKIWSWLGTSTFLGVSLCKFSIQTCTQRNHYIMALKIWSWLGTSTFLGVSLCKFSIQTCTQRNHYIMALEIWSWFGTSTFLGVSLCNFSIHTCTQWNPSPLEFFQVLKPLFVQNQVCINLLKIFISYQQIGDIPFDVCHW